MNVRTFEVTAEREGPWWVFEIPALGTGGQAHTLAEVEYEAQSVAAAWLDVPFETVDVHVTVKAPGRALAEGSGVPSLDIDGVRQRIRAEAASRGAWGQCPAQASDAWASRVEELGEPPAAD